MIYVKNITKEHITAPWIKGPRNMLAPGHSTEVDVGLHDLIKDRAFLLHIGATAYANKYDVTHITPKSRTSIPGCGTLTYCKGPFDVGAYMVGDIASTTFGRSIAVFVYGVEEEILTALIGKEIPEEYTEEGTIFKAYMSDGSLNPAITDKEIVGDMAKRVLQRKIYFGRKPIQKTDAAVSNTPSEEVANTETEEVSPVVTTEPKDDGLAPYKEGDSSIVEIKTEEPEGTERPEEPTVEVDEKPKKPKKRRGRKKKEDVTTSDSETEETAPEAEGATGDS